MSQCFIVLMFVATDVWNVRNMAMLQRRRRVWTVAVDWWLRKHWSVTTERTCVSLRILLEHDEPSPLSGLKVGAHRIEMLPIFLVMFLPNESTDHNGPCLILADIRNISRTLDLKPETLPPWNSASGLTDLNTFEQKLKTAVFEHCVTAQRQFSCCSTAGFVCMVS